MENKEIKETLLDLSMLLKTYKELDEFRDAKTIEDNDAYQDAAVQLIDLINNQISLLGYHIEVEEWHAPIKIKRVLFDCFLKDLESLDDPLLNSIFTQRYDWTIEKETKTVEIIFSSKHKLFEDWLNSSSQLWFPILQRILGKDVVSTYKLAFKEIDGK